MNILLKYWIAYCKSEWVPYTYGLMLIITMLSFAIKYGGYMCWIAYAIIIATIMTRFAFRNK